MSRAAARILTWIVILGLYTSVLATGEKQTAKREVLRQARSSYYNLTKLGFSGCGARIQPNWTVAVKDIEQNPPALKLLNGLKFFLTLSATGEVRVDHEATFPAPNAEAEKGYKQIFDGIDQLLTGFFNTWKLFMLNSPFPGENETYGLVDVGNQYVLTYSQGETSVEMTMTKNLIITDIKISEPTFRATIKPRFQETVKGKVLSGYFGSYVPTTGPGKADLNVRLEYVEVNGFQLPRKLNVSAVVDGASAESELLFTEYQLKTIEIHHDK